MPLDHSRLRELFLEACDLPEAEQTALLNRQCANDAELREELKLLLRNDARESGVFVDEKTIDGIQFRFDSVVESVLPEQVGRYRVKRVLGEGGMGVVYLAEQQNPSRKVAVKVIRSGLADIQAIARFEAERQALSMMDHPNIARVLDAGETDEGAPYFVMELVQGEPITQYCDTNKLTPKRRLELFVETCDAIQHAHHKGIIHRDLKPSNILIDVHEGNPRVKIIDFGLAKALEHQTKLTDKTVFTEFGKVVGTVRYMSPEQARLDSADIDTRTDIYSLGVVLYELLTGSTPLEKDSVHAQALLQVLEAIREKDPQRPSDRLSSSIDKRNSISALRQIQPAKLQQILRGELDWIIMRALEKDRTRRYASPNDFADDVRRYLNGEAVEAKPPSGVYRLRKFVRKNRVAVGIFAGILTLIGVATAAVFSYAVKADAAAKRSDAILQIVADSFHAVNPETGSDAKMSAKDVLINAYKALPESELDSTGKRQFLAQLNSSFFSLGDYQLALETAQRWHDTALTELGTQHINTMQSMNNLAICYQSADQPAEAMKLWKKTLQLRRAALGDNHPDTLYSMTNLGIGYCQQGQAHKGIELLQEVLQIRKAKLGIEHPDTLLTMTNLATGYIFADRVPEAMELLKTTLKLRKATLGTNHPYTLDTMSNLAYCHLVEGQLDAATKLTEESLELRIAKLGNEHPATLASMELLADCYSGAGKTARAIELREKIIQLRTAMQGAEHPKTLASMDDLGQDCREIGRFDEALKLDERTLKVRRATLGNVHVKTLSSIQNLVEDYRGVGRDDAAIELGKESYALCRTELGHDHPTTLTMLHNLGIIYLETGQSEEAMRLFEEKLELLRKKLGQDDPTTVEFLAKLVGMLAKTKATSHQIDESLLEDFRKACSGETDGDMLSTLALAEYRLENFEAAINAALASSEKLPQSPYPFNLGVLAMSHLSLNHKSEASDFREKFQQAIQTEEYREDSDCREFAVELEALFDATEE